MNQVYKKLLIGFMIVLFLPISAFVNPGKTQASSKKVPLTVLETIPEEPKGDNDWYTAVTMIKLEAKNSDQTFYQWNSTEGTWILYKDKFRALKGDNHLYYYSVKKGIAESVKQQEIKVDYQKPEIVSFTALSVNEQIKLSWESTESSRYKIYRKDGAKYRTIGSTEASTFIDDKVAIGESYTYAIKAIDQAGLRSDKVMTEITVIAKPKMVAQGKASQKIAGGQTSLPSASSEIRKIKPEAPNEVVVNQPEPLIVPTQNPVKNWNRLLVAISILVIASGAAIGGYYGYDWWTSRSQEIDRPKKKTSRW